MSYILNALRKSEQERQVNRPETLTEQVLASPTPKNRKTALMIGGGLAVNVLVLLLLAWSLKKTDITPAAKPRAGAQVERQKAAREPLSAPVRPADAITSSSPEAKKASAATAPSIEDLAEARPAAEAKVARPVPPELSERGVQAVPSPAAGRQRREGPARQAWPALEAKNSNDSDREGDVAVAEKPHTPQPARQEIPLFKELPYDFRSSAPKMSINVFMYADKPEDRFVVLNMTKYKAGQTTKESIEIREIRPDGIVASYGGRVFLMERP